DAAQAASKGATGPDSDTPDPLPPLPAGPAVQAATLIRQRRSCLGLDGRTGMDAAAFYRVLDHLLPRPQVAPWDVLPWAAQIDLALFVHRVRGIEPGLYVLERLAGRHDERRQAFSPRFEWQRAEGCPDHLALYRLMPGDL